MMPTPTFAAAAQPDEGWETLRSPWKIIRPSANEPGRTVRLAAPIDAFPSPNEVEPYLRGLERWREVAHRAFAPVSRFGVEQGYLVFELPWFPMESVLSRIPEPPAREGAEAVGALLEQLAGALEAWHAAGFAHGSVAADWIIWRRPQVWLLPPAIDSLRSITDQGPNFAADLQDWAQLAGELLTVEGGMNPDPAGKWRAIRQRISGSETKRRIRTAAALARSARRPETETTLSDRLGDHPLDPLDTILTLAVLLRATARLAGKDQTQPVLSPDAIGIRPDGDVRLELVAAGSEGAARFLSDPQYACPDLFHVAAAQLDPAKVAIYSIGFLFYELLLGRVLFQREIEADRGAGDAFWYGWHADRSKRARRLDAILPGFPVSVADRIESMIEKDPARRAKSLDALADQFQGLALPTADYHSRPVSEIGPRFVCAARHSWRANLQRLVLRRSDQTQTIPPIPRND